MPAQGRFFYIKYTRHCLCYNQSTYHTCDQHSWKACAEVLYQDLSWHPLLRRWCKKCKHLIWAEVSTVFPNLGSVLLQMRRVMHVVDWFRQHYIPHRRLEGEENHRVSFTFRMARGAPCDCPYPEFCDSQDGSLPPTRLAAQQQQDPTSNSSHVGMEHTTEANDEACSSMVTKEPEDNSSALDAQGLEDEYVHKVYDVIARHFSATRCNINRLWCQCVHCPQWVSYLVLDGGMVSGIVRRDVCFRRLKTEERDWFCVLTCDRFAIWPKVREFLEWFPTGSLLADVGCGNGKYFGVRKDILVTGLDRSAGKMRQMLSPV